MASPGPVLDGSQPLPSWGDAVSVWFGCRKEPRQLMWNLLLLLLYLRALDCLHWSRKMNTTLTSLASELLFSQMLRVCHSQGIPNLLP